ncbi:hypothetical protein HDU98_009789 [Podochytrium sp. JEL0797]|nr:hypothetical protein HDU98_009789 [Podochytrium sp. JEL0797]
MTDSMVFGFSLDWSYETPSMMRTKLNGYTPLIFNTFMELFANDANPYDNSSLNWFASEVGRVGGILELTMMPASQNMTAYSDAVFDRLGRDLSLMNSVYRVPILFRFGHEMNGDWNIYGNRPTEYIALFRRVAGFVKKYTNMTAMVWGPNIGITYPFVGGGFQQTPTTGPDFEALDTNNDGVINSLDDPYTPFYPGDDVVDWVALSLYYYPLAGCENCAVPPTYFDDYMDGNGTVTEKVLDPNLVTNMSVFQHVHDFYEKFCSPSGRNKPMLLPETGAPYIPIYASTNDGTQWTEAQIKLAWYEQILSVDTVRKYPNLIGAVNFEEAKNLGGVLRDWKLTNSTEVLRSFVGLLDGSVVLRQATEFEYACDGSVRLK